MKFCGWVSVVFYFLALVCFVLSYFNVVLGFDLHLIGMNCLGIASVLLLITSIVQLCQMKRNKKKKKKKKKKRS